MKVLIKTLFFLFVPVVAFAQIHDPFERWTADRSVREAAPGDSVPIEINFLIPPKHYLYREKMGLTLVDPPEGFELDDLELSPPIEKKDPFTGKDEEIYEMAAFLKTHLKIGDKTSLGKRSIKFLLTYQGCSEKLCYRFTRKEFEIPVIVQPFASNKAGETDKAAIEELMTPFGGHGFLIILLLTFLGGIASAFTPCVLPIIPITLAFIGVRKAEARLSRNFFLSTILVFSMSLTYAVLGLLAALLGKSLGFLFQSPYFLLLGILLYVALSLSLFGLFEIQMPLGIRNRLAKWGGAGVLGAALSGFTIGFLAAPCVGPLIASLLLYVAKTQNVVKGFVPLFAYGLGMGMLFLLIGTFYDRLAARFRGGRYTVWIERTFAVILLIPAFYYGSILYHHFREPTAVTQTSRFWIHDADQAFAKATEERKPLFVDFFASWCFPCVEMEKGTFSDEGLRGFLNDRFVPLKIDCTEETPQCQQMVEKYSVVGWPTFLILTPEGTMIESFVGMSYSAKELQDVLKPFSSGNP